MHCFLLRKADTLMYVGSSWIKAYVSTLKAEWVKDQLLLINLVRYLGSYRQTVSLGRKRRFYTRSN